MIQLQLQLNQKQLIPLLKFHGANPLKLMPMAVAAAPPPSLLKFNRLFLKSSAKPSSRLLLCRMKGDSDLISQLELGKPEERRKPEKRVNGIFWILLINIGIFVADHVFKVPQIKELYLYHNHPSWYQFITSTFCHFSWNHLSSNLFFLYIFGKLVEEEEGNFALWLSYILTGAGANLVSWLVLPRNAVSIGASGAVFGLFAVSVLVKMSWDWRKILEVLILGQFVVEKNESEFWQTTVFRFTPFPIIILAATTCYHLMPRGPRLLVIIQQTVMEAAQSSVSVGGSLRGGGYALRSVNHIAHLSGALIGVVLIWLLSSVPTTDEK